MNRRESICTILAVTAGLPWLAGCAGVRARAADTGSDAMMGRVSHKGNRTMIEGVPALHWGVGKDVTFIGALEASLASTDRPVGYVDLMGWSGLAFRFRRFEGDNGQMGSTSDSVGECSEIMTAIETTTGWRIRDLIGERIGNYTDTLEMEALAPEIAAAIDAGHPLLTYPPHWNVAVIYGYEDEGRKVLLRDYFSGDEELVLATSELVPFLYVVEEAGIPMTREVALDHALKTGIHYWSREPEYNAYNMGHYYYGPMGFDKWVDHCRVLEREGECGAPHPFVMVCLQNARYSAAGFLRENAVLLDGARRVALERAAEYYEREVALMDSLSLEDLSAKDMIEFLLKIEDMERAAVEEMARVINGESSAGI